MANADSAEAKLGEKRVPLEEGLFTFPSSPSEQPHLIGSKCPSCGKVLFPLRPRCSVCGYAPTRELALSTRGRVYSCTVFRHHRRAPGYEGPLPYAYGRVELPEGVGILTAFTGYDLAKPLAIGSEVELTLEKFGEDGEGNDIVTFKFRPVQ